MLSLSHVSLLFVSVFSVCFYGPCCLIQNKMNQSINVSSEQVRFKQTSERVYTDGRVPDEIWERVPAT